MIIIIRATKEEKFMKRQIRQGVFETNSSSVHSLTMCSAEEYKKWENGKVLFWQWKDKFGTREEIIEELKAQSWRYNVNWDDEDEVNDIFSDEEIKTCEEFFENEWFETFEQRYTTHSGDVVVAFGYYGHD
jgi:hypothetical protein